MDELHVGDWVKVRWRDGVKTGSPRDTSILEVVTTWKNDDEHFINGQYYQEQDIKEVRRKRQP